MDREVEGEGGIFSFPFLCCAISINGLLPGLR